MKIREIILQTNTFAGIQHFYEELLELSIVFKSSDKISVEVGTSLLTFILSQEYNSPYYHFAFNISEKKNETALQWLKNKGIQINQINRQDDYYDELWNAHSIYFYDPLGNIVEFIARHNLVDHAPPGEFNSKDIKNISEIGISIEDIKNASEILNSNYGLDIYKTSNEVFAPIGNEEGLFILSGLNRNWLSSNKAVKIFPLTIEIYDKVNHTDHFINDSYIIKRTILNHL